MERTQVLHPRLRQYTPNLTTLLLPGGTAGYLKIDRFPADYTSVAAALEAFYLQCAGCTDLILDLTDNSGGSSSTGSGFWWPPIDHPPVQPALGPWCGGRQQQPLSGRGLLPSAFRPLSHSAGAARADAADRALATDVLTVSIPWNRRQSRVPSADASGCW